MKKRLHAFLPFLPIAVLLFLAPERGGKDGVSPPVSKSRDAVVHPVAENIVVSGPTAPDGKTEVACDLPEDQRTKNVGGRDGAGLCVFSSIGHAARFQNERRLVDFQQKMRAEPGGGYPAKVEKMIAKYGPGTSYLQYEGKDESILKAALATGRMPSVTYDGRDPHYRGTIAHMVNLIAFTDRWACILDNNYIGQRELVWMKPADFLERWRGQGAGWAVILLAPPPPPVPRNREEQP